MDATKVEKLARFGYATKGIVYGLIGLLALLAAFGSGGGITNNEGVLQTIGSQPFGKALLALVGLGLAAYAFWKLIQASLNPENEKALKRVASLISGVVHGGLAVSAFQMLSGSGRGNSGGPSTFMGSLGSGGLGKVLFFVAGIAVLLSGLKQIHSAYTYEFTRKLHMSRVTSAQRNWIHKLGRLGHAARGVIFAIIGFGLMFGQAKGIDGALRDLASQPFGQILLGAVAAGLLAYGLFMILSARFRYVPARSVAQKVRHLRAA